MAASVFESNDPTNLWILKAQTCMAHDKTKHAGVVKRQDSNTLGDELSLIKRNLEDVDVLTSHDELLVGWATVPTIKR